MKQFNQIPLFHLLNLFLTICFNNIYDWQGRYFLLGLSTYVLPNFIGLILNYIIFFIVRNIIKNFQFLFLLLPIMLFFTNEVAYYLTEGHFVFFGLATPLTKPNIIPVDNTSNLLISMASLLSTIIIFIRIQYLNKKFIVNQFIKQK